MGYMLPTPTDWVTASWQTHKNRTPPSSEPGTDYGSAYGSVVRAVYAGTVTYIKSDNSGAMGRVVEYRLDDGRTTRTLHMAEVWVSVGQRVDYGQHLGLAGASGNGSDWYYGPHAHQTLWPGNAWAAPTIDFEPYVGNEEPDMPLTDSEIQKIAAAVWRYKMDGGTGANAVPAESGGERLRNIRRSTDGLKHRTEDIQANVVDIHHAVIVDDDDDDEAARSE